MQKAQGWQARVIPAFLEVVQVVNEIFALSHMETLKGFRPQTKAANDRIPVFLKAQEKLLRALEKGARGRGLLLSFPKRSKALPDIVAIVKNHFSVVKYMKPYDQLKEESSRSYDSACQLLEVEKLVQKWRFGKLAKRDLSFKSDERHNMIMWQGLLCGLDSLSEKELETFFNDNCKCGRAHKQENLTKLRRSWRRRYDSEGRKWRELAFKSAR